MQRLTVWVFLPMACLTGFAGLAESDMMMPGMYGPYAMSREASGTSWQPDATQMDGIHIMRGDWMYMLHGFANAGYTNQGGKRGEDQAFTTNMLMFMGERAFDQGAIGFRTMTTLEPLMGSKGYPELLQTGETADGQNPLIDRQHPHDVFMELALTGNRQITENSSVFAYGGLPGEPALGPPAFMHRLSGEDNPMAPIGHHWMDSTHITYGVLTGGYVWRDFKLEGSSFRGREPDQYHWDIENPKLDSWSGRLSFNPAKEWSSQVSYGYLHSPEQLFPTNNTRRATASVSYNTAWRNGWSGTTLVWGRNWQQGIDTLDAALLESAVNIHVVHTFFTRLEYVQKDDLTPAVAPTSPSFFGRVVDYHPFLPLGQSGPLTLEIFGVKQFTLGYIYDFAQGNYATWGIGGSGSVSLLPGILETLYGKNPLSYTLFIRVKLGRPATGVENAMSGVTIPTPAAPPVPQAATPAPPVQTVPAAPAAPVPPMSHDDLATFFDTCKPGTKLHVTLRNQKSFTGVFSSFDSVNETVWFLNPPDAFFKTKAYRLSSIQCVTGR